MKRAVTLVSAYYENPGMLEFQYDTWRDLPEAIKKNLKIILVDDGSPKNPAKHRNVGVDVQIYRVGVDVRWNQDAARNIGVHHAQTPWIMLTDMDHVVTADTWQHLMDEYLLSEKEIYTFRRVRAPDMTEHKPHPNSWFLAKEIFARIWYDERFAGYYGTDGDFKLRALRVARIVQLKAQLITFSREVIPDASTTAYTRKEPWDFENVKRIRAQRGSAPAKKLTFPYVRVA